MEITQDKTDLTALIEFVKIPADRFLMGSPKDEEGRFDDEGPQHEVIFSEPFFLGKYPVTQAQWRTVATLPKVNRDLIPDPSYFKDDIRPVEQVSWLDAMEFCDRLCQATGSFYRLPTEAEWEYACRAGTTTPFHFGETPDTTLLNCWMTGSAQATTPVGSFPANAWGLHDMHGNVWEWCQDEYCEDYKNAPTDGSAVWILDPKGDHVVMRGGSWYNDPARCRSALRGRIPLVISYNNVGFRVMRGGSRSSNPAHCRSASRLKGTPVVGLCLGPGFRVVREAGNSY